jgi:hypothetical protein
METPGARRSLGRARHVIGPAVAVVAGASPLLLASSAHACAVCFGGQANDWTGGFFLGTAMMLALPPLIVVGAGYAIYRSIKRQEARVRERDAARATLQHGAG